MKTFFAKSKFEDRNWYIVDAENQVLGRLASGVAHRLKGKHKPEYTPHVDTGDYIIVINSEKVVVTGNKNKKKKYYHHTGYPGGIKCQTFRDLIITNPNQIIKDAIKGMLPKNKLGRKMLSKLKIYEGIQHRHQAQQPKILKI